MPWTITADSSYNFNKKQNRGCDFYVLPLLRVFPPAPIGYGKKWTVHFGWLVWTVIIHFLERNPPPPPFDESFWPSSR